MYTFFKYPNCTQQYQNIVRNISSLIISQKMFFQKFLYSWGADYMGQTDMVAGVGFVNGSSFFISPICVAWPLSGSTHFPGQYTLFIENFVLVAWSLGKEEKPFQLPAMSNSMVKSQYAYRASSLSWNEPTQQAGRKILHNQKLRITYWICLWSK